jgi:hypothetical protein
MASRIEGRSRGTAEAASVLVVREGLKAEVGIALEFSGHMPVFSKEAEIVVDFNARSRASE